MPRALQTQGGRVMELGGSSEARGSQNLALGCHNGRNMYLIYCISLCSLARNVSTVGKLLPVGRLNDGGIMQRQSGQFWKHYSVPVKLYMISSGLSRRRGSVHRFSLHTFSRYSIQSRFTDLLGPIPASAYHVRIVPVQPPTRASMYRSAQQVRVSSLHGSTNYACSIERLTVSDSAEPEPSAWAQLDVDSCRARLSRAGYSTDL